MYLTPNSFPPVGDLTASISGKRVKDAPGIVAPAHHPLRFALEQNTPNPFNPATTIRFGLPEASAVRLAVYSPNGQMVRMLVDEALEAGQHEVIWDGRGNLGQPAASGVYLYRLMSGQGVLVRKMVFVR